MAPEDGTKAGATVMANHSLKHILQLLVGSPCPCSNSTKPSWRRSSLPSSWQIQRRNRTARWVRRRHRRRNHRPDSGNPCHAPDSTILFWRHSSQPANSRNHLGNCMDLPALVVEWAAHRRGESCSTTAAWPHPKRHTGLLRNCMDPPVLLGPPGLSAWGAAAVALWVAAAAALWVAAALAASAAASVEAWVAVLGKELAELAA